MNIRQIRHFTTVAETLNFRLTADRMHLSQQAISKSIMQLEKQMGVQLLERSRHKVALTEAGRRLLPFALDVVASGRRFEDALSNVIDNQFDAMAIGATPTFLESILPELLSRFNAAWPKVRITIERGDFTSLSGAMARGDLDLILSTAPDQIPRHIVKSAVIGRACNTVVVRASHPLAAKPLVRCADLLDYPHIATMNFPRGADYVSRLFAAEKLHPPRPTLTIGSTVLANEWLQMTDSWWVATQIQVLRQLEAGTFVALRMAEEGESWDLIMATRRHSVVKQSVIEFQRMVQERLRDMAPWPSE